MADNWLSGSETSDGGSSAVGEDEVIIIDEHSDKDSSLIVEDFCEEAECHEIHSGNLHITDLPAEIIEHILRFLTFDNVAKLRLVSQFFNKMCSAVLNSEFHRLRSVVQQRFMSLKAQMPRRESSRRKHPLARESDIIETLYMRLTLLNMTFGKHIERKYCCFFAGEILDEIYKILHYIKSTPSLSRAYKVTDELFDLSTMAMEYFKEHIEPHLPEVTYFAADILEQSVFKWLPTTRFRASLPSATSIPGQMLSCHNFSPSAEGKSHKAPCTPHVAEAGEPSTSTGAPPRTSNNSFQVLAKSMKILKEIMKKNRKDINSLKRSLKHVTLKVNNMEEITQQLQWQQKNSEGSAHPENHQINEFWAQVNLLRHELELLKAGISATSGTNNQGIEQIGILDDNLNKNIVECSRRIVGNHNCTLSVSPHNIPHKSSTLLDGSNKGELISVNSYCVPSSYNINKRKASSSYTNRDKSPERKRACKLLASCFSLQENENSAL